VTAPSLIKTKRPQLAFAGRLRAFAARDADALLARYPQWELEIGFGKGRYLLRSAAARTHCGFIGIEIASEYFRIAAGRAQRQGLENLSLLHGDALLLLAAYLPVGFANAVHVYFPDPWPKSRHHKRRLFDPVTVDLVLGALGPEGTLYFATDHPEYGARVQELFARHPELELRSRTGPWPEGARTNYEAKYIAEGRPIVRLEVRRSAASSRESLLHPDGRSAVLAAGPSPRPPALGRALGRETPVRYADRLLAGEREPHHATRER
jgi:tRNA (guanine-N7-)-methyltransferase